VKGFYEMIDAHPASGREGLITSILKKIGTKGKKDDDVTGEEIMDMVNEGHEHGVLNENEAEMIGNIFEFSEKQAHDVMTHRKSIVAIDSTTTVREAFDFIMNESYSRYPVIENDVDNILGILHIRDLLKVYVDEENRERQLKDLKHQILFSAYYIPETRNISSLFQEMQSKKVHIAVVVDEYGQTAGIVTMEDILEEIVGNIQDEYDEEEELIRLQSDDSYLIDGQMPLEDLEEIFGIHFECEDIDTINGYMIYKLGKIPEEGEQFETECEGYLFSVETVENKMIRTVRARKTLQQETDSN
jgi:putative hemolysin